MSATRRTSPASSRRASGSPSRSWRPRGAAGFLRHLVPRAPAADRPQPPGDEMPKSDNRRRTTQRGRILIIEDHEMVRALSCEVLRRAGFDVDEASDGLVGVRMLEDLTRTYCVIVSDLGLLGVRGE